ncbi:membrane fusion protein (multidrug efflux system) [Paenochrobactrum gallinarii]|uniref:Membrane fusion protein (Multidrug efflux system) n=1 Tax=Paenochrobactrum gallinarii TaxID=643673 RepID=A0A841LXM5_9HYPH|nr:efflux RND transporter periplasmic adaptor subunit [Paenochrobactrum gallinarii]MBB6262106.1 membrane fusion protein (multidrug efflux system) [Paenochrobactrum gallinarii]
MKKHTYLYKVAAVMLAASFLTACNDQPSAGGAAPAMPPMAVSFIELKPEALPILNDLPGRIAPTRLAEVRPRVSGIVVERVFEQGTKVQQGDVLYRIDPAPFQVKVDMAEATLARAKATQLQARQANARQEQLRKSNVSSAQNLETAVAQLAQANADVAAAEASLNEAKLNLQYAEVTAPISGQIGRALITEGALVSANSPENLATIQQLDPIYADFTQPAADLIRLRKALQNGKLMTGPNEAEVRLLLDDGSLYPTTGRLLFSEAAVDTTTGQVTLRGEFPNPDGDLLPGMYVRVQIEQGIEKNALAVPQQAVQRNADGLASILVVNADNVVELRSVHVNRILGDRFVISGDVKEGDRVITEGFQKTAPGATVAPVPFGAEKPTAEVAKDKGE